MKSIYLWTISLSLCAVSHLFSAEVCEIENRPRKVTCQDGRTYTHVRLEKLSDDCIRVPEQTQTETGDGDSGISNNE